MRRRLAALLGLALLASGQETATQTSGDPVAVLIQKIDDGSVRLTREGESGYLRSLLKALDQAIAALVDRMLFVDELPLTAPIRGTSGFAEEFQALGPRDRKGRSLRDLDLTQGLMRYPLSYMIYSPQFDALKPPIRTAIYRRLWTVLSGADRDAQYARLSSSTRAAVVEILRDTRRGLPEYFR
jgi:hypothetical protein